MADLLQIEAFRTVLEDTPLEDEFSSAHLAAAFSLLPEIAKEWRRAKDDELVEILKQHVPGATHSSLRLASTVFACDAIVYGDKVCGERLSYPRVLTHNCTSSSDRRSRSRRKSMANPPYLGSDSSVAIAEVSVAQLILGTCVPWNLEGDRITYDEVASRNAKAVVVACGLDPQVATVGDLELLNPMIECSSCLDAECGRLVMHWMQAVCFCRFPTLLHFSFLMTGRS